MQNPPTICDVPLATWIFKGVLSFTTGYVMKKGDEPP